ncbi:hypothetical protein ACQPXB_43720 [Amycolatopsis sp. CA-161197]|uniref:hypothetical protein n=1 Tax=unclassified Amycolatopsis TaxID=2618356 RepID=UPI0036C2045E
MAQVASDVASRFSEVDPETRRVIVERVCRLAVSRCGSSAARLREGLDALRQGDAAADLQAAVNRLTEDLDVRAWTIQDEVDAHRAREEEYFAAFRAARASASVGFALAGAFEDALYEAWHAIDDRDAFVAATTDPGERWVR